MDTITIAEAPGRLLTKSWRRSSASDPVATPYDQAKYCRFRSATVGGIRDLASVLDQVSADPHSAVIRAEPKAGVVGKLARRLLKDRPDAKATLDAKPRRWLLLDFDDCPLPAGSDAVRDPERLVRHAVSFLPAAFREVSCWWAFTSGMGMKPGLRLRLAFWLDRAMSEQELKLWLRDVPVDKAVFRAVQLIYVAPIFDDQVIDPLAAGRRSGFFEAPTEIVAAPNASDLAPTAAPARLASASISNLASGSWQEALAALGDGPGLSGGFYEPVKVAIGRFFQQHGSKVAVTEFRATIVDRLRSAPRDKRKHDDQYVLDRIADLDGWIGWTRAAQKETEDARAAELANATDPWSGERVSLAFGSEALDTWLMVYFCHNHPDANDVRADLAAHEQAVGAWRERHLSWVARQDFLLDEDIFADRDPVEPAPVPPNGYERVGIKVTAGVGKTTATVRELAARIHQCNERAVYAVPNHAKCEEIAREFAKHGVQAEIWNGFSYPKNDPSCERANEARELIAVGGGLADLCKECPLHPKRGGACAYQTQRAKKPDVWVIPHATLRYAPRMHDCTFDWLVIDEAYSVPIREISLKLDDLCSVESGARRRNSSSHEAALGHIREILRQHPKGAFTRTAFDRYDSEQCEDRAGSVMVDHMPPAGVPADELAHVSAVNERVKKRRAFWTLLGAFLASDHPASGRLEWTGKEVKMQVPEFIADGWLQAHVLAIDATLDEAIVKTWLPGLRVWTEIDVEHRAFVRFVKDPPVAFNKIVPGSNIPTVLRTQENNLRRIWHRIEAEAGARAALGQDILAVMPKGAEDWIRREYDGRLPANLHIDHFGNLRGINRYEHVAKAIVLSRAQLHLDEIQRLVQALFDKPIDPLPTEYLARLLRRLRMRDGSTQFVSVDAHPVEEAQALLEQVREAEVEQAAHRLRPVRRECEIDLISIVGIDMTIDQTLSFEEWITEGDITALALARGVLPETQTELAKVVSDVCPDRNALKYRFNEDPAARRDYEAALAAANVGKTPYIDSLIRRFTHIRVDTSELPAWPAFRCRMAGKRKSFRVWIVPSAADPRALAEQYFGALDGFDPEDGAAQMQEKPISKCDVPAVAPTFNLYTIAAEMGVSRLKLDRQKARPEFRSLPTDLRERQLLEWICATVGKDRFRVGVASLRSGIRLD